MYYNLGSLAFGLLAWALPVDALIGGKKTPLTRAGLTSLSFACCALSLFLQIVNGKHLVELADWSALLDTQSAVVWVSGTLLAVTVLLNALVWATRIGRKQ